MHSFTKYLDNDVVFIVPEKLKEEILLYLNKNNILLNLSFTSLEELKTKCSFSYDERALYELSRNYNLSVLNAKMYIDNLIYPHFNRSPLIENLNQMYDFLISKQLLTFDSQYFSFLNNKKVIMMGYYDNDFFTNLIKDKISNLLIISNSVFDQKIPVYEFDSLSSEVEFITYKISELLSNGVDIEKIKIINAFDDYKNEIKKLFSFYNIQVDLEENRPLYVYEMAKKFLELIESHTFEEALLLIKEIYSFDKEENVQIYNKIIKVCNRYNWYLSSPNEIKDLLLYSFKSTFLEEAKKDKCVRISSLEIEANLDNYVFLIGFNQSVFPLINKDEDLLSDKTKAQLGFNTSVELNKMNKLKIIDLIKKIKNIIISYKLNSTQQKYYPSNLLEPLNIDLIKNYKSDLLTSFSTKYDQLNLADKLDNLIKYSHIDENLDLLYNNYPDIFYRQYNNSFKGLNIDNFHKSINHKLNISSTSLTNFFKCGFRYYLHNILKLEEEQETFSLTIGNLFHSVLSRVYEDDFDFEKVFSQYYQLIELSDKEKVLMIKLKDSLKSTINNIKEQYLRSDFKKVVIEKRFSIEIKSKLSVILSGVIDKIMIMEDDDVKYGLVVDYKTGNFSGKLDFLEEGINIQLPIYFHLLRQNPEYANIFIVGYYFQKILHREPRIKKIDENEKIVFDNHKLSGYTLYDNKIIGHIDNLSNKKSYLKGVKFTKEGLKKGDYLVSKDELESVYQLISRKISEAIRQIEAADFIINPKMLDGKDYSCINCPFREICYRKADDFIKLTTPNKEEKDDDDDDSYYDDLEDGDSDE